MKYIQILIISLVPFIAQFSFASNLPISVQIDKKTKIIEYLMKNQNCHLINKHIDQLQNLTPILPLSIQFYQSTCYYKQGDMKKTLQSLEAYFSSVKNTDSNYLQALEIYISAEKTLLIKKEADEQQRLSLQLEKKQTELQLQQSNEIELQRQKALSKIQWPMININAGCFYMGSLENNEEKPMHRVCLDKSYSIGQFEVTQQLWQVVMQEGSLNSSSNSSCISNDCPITSVSWKNIQIFIDKLNKIDNKHYRLPSEEEWEYACRNLGKNQRSCTENSLNAISHSYSAKVTSLKEVKQTPHNLIDIFGMNGNASEWVMDDFSPNYHINNPIIPSQARAKPTKVIRNACCYNSDDRINLNRFGHVKTYADDSVGFRLAQDL